MQVIHFKEEKNSALMSQDQKPNWQTCAVFQASLVEFEDDFTNEKS